MLEEKNGINIDDIPETNEVTETTPTFVDELMNEQRQLEGDIQSYRQMYYNQGYDDESVNLLIEQHPFVQRARESINEKMLVSNYTDLQEKNPNMITKPEDVPAKAWQIWDANNRSISMSQAFKMALEDDNVNVHMPSKTLEAYMDMGMTKAEAQKHYKKLYR